MHAPSELHVREDGTFQVSFEGANKWGWHPYNCTPAAIQGGIWVMLTQTVIPGRVGHVGFGAHRPETPDERQTPDFALVENVKEKRDVGEAYLAPDTADDAYARTARTPKLFHGR